jgi:hypothetical protein
MTTYRELHLRIPAWTREEGTTSEWDQAAFLRAQVNDGKTIIEGNGLGFELLARLLLTLSAADVPAGTHVHLDTWGGLAPDTTELTLERVSP